MSENQNNDTKVEDTKAESHQVMVTLPHDLWLRAQARTQDGDIPFARVVRRLIVAGLDVTDTK